MGQVNLISQSEYAKHRGVSEAAVSKAIKAKRISLIDGKIDPTAADAQWARNSRVRAGSRPGAGGGAGGGSRAGAGQAGGASAGVVGPGAGKSTDLPGPLVGDVGDDKPGGDDYWNSRSRREAAEAELAEIELAERNGQVIQVKAVESAWSQALSATREHLLQVRARLAPMLAQETDPFKIEQLLDAEHSQALQHMAAASLQPSVGAASAGSAGAPA